MGTDFGWRSSRKVHASARSAHGGDTAGGGACPQKHKHRRGPTHNDVKERLVKLVVQHAVGDGAPLPRAVEALRGGGGVFAHGDNGPMSRAVCVCVCGLEDEDKTSFFAARLLSSFARGLLAVRVLSPW